MQTKSKDARKIERVKPVRRSVNNYFFRARKNKHYVTTAANEQPFALRLIGKNFSSRRMLTLGYTLALVQGRIYFAPRLGFFPSCVIKERVEEFFFCFDGRCFYFSRDLIQTRYLSSNMALLRFAHVYFSTVFNVIFNCILLQDSDLNI